MPRSPSRNILILICFLQVNYIFIANSQDKFKQWVYFVDKGFAISLNQTLSPGSIEYHKANELISQRALKRRAKVLPESNLLDAADLPLSSFYIEQIQKMGGELMQQSRWINAASFLMTKELADKVAILPFVKKVVPVKSYKGIVRKVSSSFSNEFSDQHSLIDYGQSYKQIQMINVVPLHTAGITGKGVLIGMLDSGFRWKNHEALKTRNVIAEHDFIFNDDVTSNEENDSPNQDAHGTLTFSIISGYQPGKLIGTAFDADFILAKTEYVPTEYRGEEDNWAAAIEWMESYGVDVISSSVGYNIFDDGTGYSWENGDFDGRTSVTAKAAARAARLGVVVCTSMGNEGNGNGIVGTLLTPADADSIISVGGVTFSGNLAYFSSTGPTNDGRIKPDVIAPAVGVYHATIPGPNTYGSSQGNSVSTPLVAGTAALILSARPELTPIEIRNALRQTAVHVDSVNYPIVPNNFTGWGLVDAFNASLIFGPIFSNIPTLRLVSKLNEVSITVISKYGIKPDDVVLHYALTNDTAYSNLNMQLDSSYIYQTSGKYSVLIPEQPIGTPIKFYITAEDSSGRYYQSPPIFKSNAWSFYYGDTNVQLPSLIPKSFNLMQNYPNPFNGSTKISYDLPYRTHVTLKVYNLIGQLITTLVDEIQDAGDYKSRPPIIFEAHNFPSGVYFYRLSTPNLSITKKMIIIR